MFDEFLKNGNCDQKNVITQMFQRPYNLFSILVTAMAAYIPDDVIEGKKTACKTFIPIQPFKYQRQPFKQLKKFRNTEVHGWACKDRYDFT